MQKSKLKPIPSFKNEDEEREFWMTHDSTEYIDYSKAVELDLSDLKPSMRSISIRLPKYLLQRIKELANAKDVPYQSLMKMYLSDRVEEELSRNGLSRSK